MTGRKLGSQLQHLDQLVASSTLRGVDPGDEDDGGVEPGGPDDPLDGVDRGIDAAGLVGREGGMGSPCPLGQLPERETRA